MTATLLRFLVNFSRNKYFLSPSVLNVCNFRLFTNIVTFPNCNFLNFHSQIKLKKRFLNTSKISLSSISDNGLDSPTYENLVEETLENLSDKFEEILDDHFVDGSDVSLSVSKNFESLCVQNCFSYFIEWCINCKFRKTRYLCHK